MMICAHIASDRTKKKVLGDDTEAPKAPILRRRVGNPPCAPL